MAATRQKKTKTGKGNAMLIRPEEQAVIGKIREKLQLIGISDPQIIRLVLNRFLAGL